METSEKLVLLRDWMTKTGIDACLITSSDAHLSEYVGDHWKGRQWITGFTGSAGTAVITKNDAGLWTDGRYFIQAANQLDGSGVRLFRMTEPDVPTYGEWLADVMPAGGCLCIDGSTISVSDLKKTADVLADKSIEIRTDLDPVGSIWDDRPELPRDKVFLHDYVFAGKSRGEKLAQIREQMKKNDASYYLLSAIDEICWLYNIRGNDIPFNPFVTSFALISESTAALFVDTAKVPEAVRESLDEGNIQIREYGEIYGFLSELDGCTLLYDPEKTNAALVASLQVSVRKKELPGLVTPLKAVKNEVEIKNIYDAFIKDATALVRLFKWLREAVPAGHVTELDVDAKGLAFRKELPLFMGLSFGTISAYGDHAAMMHYAPKYDNQYTLEARGFYLIDSGAHFLNGTTDITRTIALGPLSMEEKKDFTLVLKSLIALSKAKFLYGATGSNLDVLARIPMWENGLDYKCGTGHGLGYFSSVHEAPQRFAIKQNDAKLEKGMIITVEPGVYKEGRYGIRTENTLLVVEDEVTQCGTFMRFETLCYLPIDRSALLPEMLTGSERSWINQYHEKVFEKLSPHLDEEHREWLKKETAAI